MFYMDCRIYRETPAIEEGDVEQWDLMLDDMIGFKKFMKIAMKSTVPSEEILYEHLGDVMEEMCEMEQERKRSKERVAKEHEAQVTNHEEEHYKS